MPKFPIDSHSNENFISPFFRPPGAANSGRRVVEISLTEPKKQKKKHTVKQITSN